MMMSIHFPSFTYIIIQPLSSLSHIKLKASRVYNHNIPYHYHMSDSDYFQVIDSNYQLIQNSMREDTSRKDAPIRVYQAKITPTKNQVDLNLLQNQYYEFELYKFQQKIAAIQRRYSDFALLFDILAKRQPGFIFPAFPQNGIFAFMKTKVTVVKDETFINTRIRVIERFFTKLLNQPQYNPQTCKEIKEFLSEGKQFQARKQIEKGNGGGVLGGFSWNKLKTYFAISKENKYKEHEERILQLKAALEGLYVKCHQMIQLLTEQRIENTRIQQLQDTNNYLFYFKQLMASHDTAQLANLTDLQSLDFSLFCQNQDLMMAKRIIDRMNQLKNDEDNYNQLKQTEEKFNNKIDNFLIDKSKKRQMLQEELQTLVKRLKNVSRFTH